MKERLLNLSYIDTFESGVLNVCCKNVCIMCNKANKMLKEDNSLVMLQILGSPELKFLSVKTSLRRKSDLSHTKKFREKTMLESATLETKTKASLWKLKGLRGIMFYYVHERC
jgi:hypothetical protein